MPIIGLNLKSVKAFIDERKQIDGEINVNSAPVVESIEKKDLERFGLKDVLVVNFTFSTMYEPKIGEIHFDGEVLYTSDKHKEVLNRWKKDKRLDETVAAEILNAIFKKCLSKAVDIAQELRLPPPIQFPIVKIKD